MTPVSEENSYLSNPRWAVAEQVAGAARRRWPADVLAVGVHGPLAHDVDARAGDVAVTVITYRSGGASRTTTRRVAGVLVGLCVVGADDYLRQARTLTPSWPLTADRYVTTRAVHDPTRWLVKLREAHLGRLADARQAEFTAMAREAWYPAASALARATRLAEWYDTDAAVLMLGEARLSAATVAGLLSRTYFRDGPDAVRSTGLAAADLTELAATLNSQAADLTHRGRPVDGPVDSLFD
ncbi:MAG TPA: nucleotidyltransferase domain-containing protein [Catenuloplanes sp.]|jgi:hypothetical protein